MLLPGPRSGLTWPVRVDPTGADGPTRGAARSSRWRRTSQGLYVPASAPSTTDQRIVEAAALLPPLCGVTGWAALHWAGGIWFDGLTADLPRPVALATGSADVRRQPGMVLTQERLGRDELRMVDGLSTTLVARAVFFEMRYAASTSAAVRVLDLACFSDLVSIQEMSDYIAVRTGWTGVQRSRDALVLAVENCWSPRETSLRLTWRLLARLPPPLCNRPIFDLTGRHLATPDLFDPEAGLAVEYDGRLHLEGTRRRRDRDRLELLDDHHIDVVTVMAGDTADRVAERLARRRARALARRPTTPPWTLDPPAWWIPTDTVAARRALAPWLRDRWLAPSPAGRLTPPALGPARSRSGPSPARPRRTTRASAAPTVTAAGSGADPTGRTGS